MKPNRGFGNVRKAVVPFVWVEEAAGVEGSFEWMLRAAIYPMLAIDYGSVATLVGGLALMAYTGAYALYKRQILYPPKSEKPIVSATPGATDTNTTNIYPNLNANPFTVSGRMAEKGKGPNTSPINGTGIYPNLKQQRAMWSPPGSAE
ncbi:unnamed protein product [Oppiella nova]|uniref:Uncharacterized protein n=1 Tax=Oppiella nova TaxID=334625 RepID=A0A7R9MJ41_9ACAR|nr:unnamed protein product [Oppiella nova]CAG2178319.1 unnamed protein product [Oppiella nova]